MPASGVEPKFVPSDSHFRHAGLVPASMSPQGVQALFLRLVGPPNKSGVTLGIKWRASDSHD